MEKIVKETYEAPTVELVDLQAESIVCASGEGFGDALEGEGFGDALEI